MSSMTQRPRGLQSQSYLESDPLQKKFADPALRYKLIPPFLIFSQSFWTRNNTCNLYTIKTLQNHII